MLCIHFTNKKDECVCITNIQLFANKHLCKWILLFTCAPNNPLSRALLFQHFAYLESEIIYRTQRVLNASNPASGTPACMWVCVCVCMCGDARLAAHSFISPFSSLHFPFRFYLSFSISCVYARMRSSACVCMRRAIWNLLCALLQTLTTSDIIVIR